jgi:hypothetical protein
MTPAPRGGPAAAPGRPVLVFFDDRPSPLLEALLARTDIQPVLLRFSDALGDLDSDHLAATEDVPTFEVRVERPLGDEVARFHHWVEGLGLRPRHFCNPSEARQEAAQGFARAAGLPALGPVQVGWVRDKYLMTERLAEIGFTVARHRLVQSPADIVAFGFEDGWPVVVKPRDSYACIDTYLVRSPGEVAVVGDLTRRRFVAESYQGGVEYELCALLRAGSVVAAWISSMPVRPLDLLDGGLNANISWPRVPDGFPVEPRTLAARIASGLRLADGYLHAEFFLDGDRLSFGEVGLRLAGCAIPRNHALANGFDVLGALLDIHVGRSPELTATCSRFVGDLLLPAPCGQVVELSTPEELLAMPQVIECRMKVAVGDIIPYRRASHHASGTVHIEGRTAAEVECGMRSVLDRFRIVVSEHRLAKEA